jgi:hypothetical protein
MQSAGMQAGHHQNSASTWTLTRPTVKEVELAEDLAAVTVPATVAGWGSGERLKELG